MTTEKTAPKPSPEGLLRGIRKWDLVAVAINGIIGAGIFGLPAKVYALIGGSIRADSGFRSRLAELVSAADRVRR